VKRWAEYIAGVVLMVAGAGAVSQVDATAGLVLLGAAAVIAGVVGMRL
jgi:hypothetical protein